MHVRRLQESFGWYDLAVRVDSDALFERQLAGHVETGRPSMSDPAIGAAVPQTADVA
jgi:phospholipase C